MYQPTELYEAHSRALQETLEQQHDLPKWLARRWATLIMKVELALELIFQLPTTVESEPLAVIPELLSGTPMNYPTLKMLNQTERRALANTRVLLSTFAGPYSWESALREYAEEIEPAVPQQCHYNIEPRHFDRQIISNGRNDHYHQDTARRRALKSCLTQKLPYQTRPSRLVEAGKTYEFEIHAEKPPMRLRFTPDEIRHTTTQLDWFTSEKRPQREPIAVTIEQLLEVARYFDEKEDQPHWEQNLSQIALLMWDGLKGEQAQTLIKICGLMHVVGMVSSGKSTLMKLWAGWLVYSHREKKLPPKRITIVLQDSASTIELAHFFNHMFCNDPETEQPVAVPLLGRSTRHKHLQQMMASQSYNGAITTGNFHWGERSVNPVCLLNGRSEILAYLDEPLQLGSEPCHNLKEATDKKLTVDHRPRHQCPLFAICPSHQNGRDSFHAQIWVTTAGAMGQGTLPAQLEQRRMTLGDLVYEQSDLVVFDEVDSIIEWFDRLFAKQQHLIAGGNGILDRLDSAANRYWYRNRLQSDTVLNWINAQRSFHQPVTNIVTLTAKHKHLQQNLERGYFTARSLFYRLARRMLGLKEYDRAEEDNETKQLLQILTDLFEVVMRERDPLDVERLEPFRGDLYALHNLLVDAETAVSDPDTAEKNYRQAVQQSAHTLMDAMHTMMHSNSQRRVTRRFRDWLIQMVPDLETRLTQLRHRLKNSSATADQLYLAYGYADKTINQLALRLQLTANAVLLDRFTRLVFYQWDNRPSVAIQDEQPYTRLPAGLRILLPLPSTGRLFGIYHISEPPNGESKNSDSASNLSTFAYTNIGRKYITNFHTLRQDLEGEAGPNVLVMSGTSYLPDSTKWHFGEPDALLQRRDSSSQPAITKALTDPTCWFKFRPVYEKNGRPIRISGNPNKQTAVESMIRQLTTDPFNQQGLIGKELRDLHALGESQPHFWADRARLLLLVNSYEQCQWAGEELRRQWPERRAQIHYLVRTNEDEEDAQLNNGRYQRVDIEQFAQKGGQILIAPLQAIGRGFNILNAARQAAFGAIFFLTRPMPHPHDIGAIAQELNCRADEWVADDDFAAWQMGATIYESSRELRKIARTYWRDAETRKFYSQLIDEKDPNIDAPLATQTGANPRRDLAATTAGRVIQATGRLLRGDVPFHAYFIDAAWAPQQAKRLRQDDDTEERPPTDTAKTSLLYAMIETLEEYATDDFGRELYQPFINKLLETENLYE